MGSDPSLYADLFADPRYLTTVINTLLFVGVGVNVKMFLAFLLSGFFMRREPVDQGAAGALHAALGVAGDAGVPVDALDADRLWRLPQQRAGGAVRHRRADLVQFVLARDGREHPRLHLEVDAVLDADLPGRPDGDPAGHL